MPESLRITLGRFSYARRRILASRKFCGVIRPKCSKMPEPSALYTPSFREPATASAVSVHQDRPARWMRQFIPDFPAELPHPSRWSVLLGPGLPGPGGHCSLRGWIEGGQFLLTGRNQVATLRQTQGKHSRRFRTAHGILPSSPSEASPRTAEVAVAVAGPAWLVDAGRRQR